MTPVYLNSQPQSSIPFIDLNKDNNNHQQNIQVFGYLYGGDHHLSTSTNSSFSYNPNNTLNSSEMFSFDYTSHDHVKVEKVSDLDQQCSSWIQNRVGEDSRSSNNYTTYSMNMEEKNQKNESVNNSNNNENNKYSRKWKSSKVRIKMMTNSKNSRESRSKQEDDHDLPKRQINNDGIRVCTDCHTTTTPLWRSGPQGPKSLCNACGIRQRKARRAAMAAAAAATTSFSNDATVTSMSHVGAPKPKVQMIKSEKGLDRDNKNHTLPLKKRSKIINATNKNYNDNNNNNNNNYYTHNNSKKICFEDLALNPNKDSSMRSFPRDEEEGAILLMALSCGLACYSY